MGEKGLDSSRILIIMLVAAIGVSLVGNVLTIHTIEAKSKKKGYDVVFFLDVDAPTKHKKTLVTVGIENIKNKIVVSKKQDIRPQVEDNDDSEPFPFAVLHVTDKKGQHPSQVAPCVIVNHAHDDERCGGLEGGEKNDGVPLYHETFSYAEILQLVFGVGN